MMTDIEHKTYFEDIGAWPRGSRIIGSYVTGFVISILLTALAYFFVIDQGMFTQAASIYGVVMCAFFQFIAQAILFFHLGKEKAALEKLVVFGFAMLVVTILVSGSVWIMFSLDARQMPTTAQMEQYMNSQIGM